MIDKLIKIWLITALTLLGSNLFGQAFVNGSFENTSASVACNYNLGNAAFNGLMANTNAFGAGQECDILISGCFQPSIPDGIRAVGLAHVPLDEIAMDLTAPLVAGNSYTISFWSYSETTFRVQGDIEIGVSAVNNNFGTLVYVAPTVAMTWVQHTFTFVCPANSSFITVRNINDGIIHWNHVDHFEFDNCTTPNIDMGMDTTLCPGDNLMLDASIPGGSYVWQDNSTNATFNVTQAGTYFVEATDACGTVYDTINVAYDTLPVVELGNDTTLCPGATLILDATNSNSTYLWQDNSVNATFNVTQSGNYSVDVTNYCGTVSDNIIVDYDVLPVVDLGNDTTLCPGATLLLDATNTNSTYLWQDNSTNATFNVTQAGNYSVDVTNYCGTVSDNIIVDYDVLPIVDLGNDTILCPGATLLLDATNSTSTYLWQDNSTNATFNVTQAGNYSVDVANFCGAASDVIVVDYDVLPIVNLGNDTTLCTGATLLLDAANVNSTYLWQDNSTNATFNVIQAGNYSVDVTNNCGTTSDLIVIDYDVLPVVDLGNDTTLCNGANLLLDATNSNSTYLWQDNSTNPTFNITQAGIYSVDVTNNCGTTSDIIVVDYDALPIVNLGNDTTLCTGATILLDATNSNATYLWQDNSANATYNVVQAGIYSVDVANFCGTVSDEIIVSYGNSPSVNLGNDTSLCPGSQLIIDATTPGVTYLWQDNSTNSTFNASQSGAYYVTVSNNCGTATDTINVSFNAILSLDLGNDTTICQGSSLLLNVDIPNSNIVWQDLSVGPSFIVTESGTYAATVSVDGCIVQDDIVVSMSAIPTIDLGSDIAICEESHVMVSANPVQSGDYLWNDGTEFHSNILHDFGEYWLSLTNSCGTVVDTIRIIDLGCHCTIYFPNAFTPDGDEFNQSFSPQYDCVLYSYELNIYNRWGEKIFTSFDPDGIWDGTYGGTLVPSGTYTYTVEYKVDFLAAETKTLLGHVNVLR